MRVYASRDDLPAGRPHVLALTPLWGPPEPPWWPYPGYVDDLAASGVFTPAGSPAEADAAFFPEDWKHARQDPDGLERAGALVDAARDAGIPAAFFWASDSTEQFPFPDAFVFRPSLFRSRRRAREHALPGFHEDLLAHVGELPLRAWQEKPTVGFCGHAVVEPRSGGVAGRARRAVGDVRRATGVRLGLPLRADIFVRRAALEQLAAQDDVDALIVMRDEYNGVETQGDEALWRQLRREYVDNMLASDYVLCARGNGNYSYRLTEALSLGRIPVFVDTDCVLPYASEIDWRSHVLWLDRRDVPRIGERILAFHRSLTPEQFAERQRRCRALYLDWLSPQGFFANLHRALPV